MKKISILISLLLVLALTGCTDWLNLKPQSQIVLEDYWQTESQATAVLSSCYRGLTENPCMERMLVWGELRSDNLVEGYSTNADMLKILAVNLTSSNSYS